MSLQGKHALVTGGSRGIGRAIAERLAHDGATVVLSYASDHTAAQDTVATITKAGGQATAVHAPFGTHGDADRLWQAYDQATSHAGVDIIVNNAGIGRSSDLLALTEDEFDRVFAVNVRAPFFVAQGALSRLRDHGRVINISSGLARIAMPEIMAYGSTKGALDTFSLNLAKVLGPRGITVNSVAPGITATDVTADWLGDQEAAQWAASVSALGRIGQPDDIAAVVAFLASEDGRWVSGRVVDATGGSGL
ncbi:SDR family oxidoreductase [Catenulispora sp. NF23]|uniref:SDR family oxidoreductase n=1 Tax=Catenulispora pinistramenti TaxID=2705254 RepID=A0ABS5L8X2_9ACTN|nr:SDR family oxidoreductase [Catenulispora pinistramenti]MBS2540069.1 SDR family oxidoreductase [Catenulispora pinistramenti]MBS2554665.1 SDR family oxidoreductase [Catenulispora pinistramenti]